MYTRQYSISSNRWIAVSPSKNSELSGVLGRLAELCTPDGSDLVTVSVKKGVKFFGAGSYSGFACFTDGTLVEILPRTQGEAEDARRELCEEFCKRIGHTFDPSKLRPEMNFMEYFISVFAAETMKIIKSGVLSAYASREENLTSVQGTILFAENIRRNLAHKERLYVRHDVFTSDRAENRIIKAAAQMLNKITADGNSSHLLKEALSYLDEVKVPRNIKAEFSQCINTRNTKKYSTVLSICRMLFDEAEGSSFTEKNIACAQFYRIPAQAEKK